MKVQEMTGMNYELTEEQQSIKENFKKFCDNEIKVHADELDKADKETAWKLLRDNLRKLADLGYLGMGHGEAYGGTDQDLISQAIAGEEVSRACASTFLSAGASCGLFGVPLRLFGSEAQKARYIPGIIKGELIGSFGLTAPD